MKWCLINNFQEEQEQIIGNHSTYPISSSELSIDRQSLFNCFLSKVFSFPPPPRLLSSSRLTPAGTRGASFGFGPVPRLVNSPQWGEECSGFDSNRQHVKYAYLFNPCSIVIIIGELVKGKTCQIQGTFVCSCDWQGKSLRAMFHALPL